MENGKEEPNQSYRMTILKYSDTEYMIRWPFEVFDEIFYIRGYPIKIGGITIGKKGGWSEEMICQAARNCL